MSTGKVTAASGWSSSVGMKKSESSSGAAGSASFAGGVAGGGVAGGGLLAGGVPAGGVLAGGGVPAGGASCCAYDDVASEAASTTADTDNLNQRISASR
jgi:hypothetical protein